ncbi:GGDEF domain-containing response regulator [Desulfovibrio oxyclinae]|uniref:GGDEF domain-containing response regulator n=1 Tax=Desulfovibrio oxyclinae TaxID=63560 RepID=UPI0003634B92|nr:diguanylate cyclase [Desulfovibrio oxyclinae]
MQILIIDDSETSQLLLTTILGNAGYSNIVSAYSYDEAHSILESCRSKEDCTDLVLMDINMPGVDGIQATRLLKADPATEDIPIIVVTGVEDEMRLQAAFSAGANDYIQKPVSRVELQARVRSALKLREEMQMRHAREKELEELNAKLRKISSIDGLTGVGNRRWFDERFEQEWKRARRDRMPLSLLLIDIDNFKQFNDSQGHIQGDQCLRRVAAILQESTRRAADMVARYGGEEFVVVLPNTDSTGAKDVAEMIMKQLEGECIEHPDSPAAKYVTVSIGLATATPDGSTGGESLIEAADNALYQAKDKGKNRIESAA